MQTKLTLAITHTRPIPELCDLVAGRAYTLQHVEGVDAAITPDTVEMCHGDRFAELNALVVKWASDRKIVQNSNVLAQAKKSLEEVGELVEAAAKMQAVKPFGGTVSGVGFAEHFKGEYKDAIGDVMVTLLVGCATAGVDPLDCLQLAYDEIKDRKGHLDANGVFHKVST